MIGNVFEKASPGLQPFETFLTLSPQCFLSRNIHAAFADVHISCVEGARRVERAGAQPQSRKLQRLLCPALTLLSQFDSLKGKTTLHIGLTVTLLIFKLLKDL